MVNYFFIRANYTIGSIKNKLKGVIEKDGLQIDYLLSIKK